MPGPGVGLGAEETGEEKAPHIGMDMSQPTLPKVQLHGDRQS